MQTFNNKMFLILTLSMLTSAIFYISQLLYVSKENANSSKIYVQSLIDSIDRYEFLPLLIAEHHLVQKAFKTPDNTDNKTNKKLKSIALQTGADAIYLMNLYGKVIASSNYDSQSSFLNKNYAFRPYFQGAINEETRQFYYAKGATTGIPGFFISMPIYLDSVLHGVAVVKLELAYWEDGWKNSKDNILVADQNNIILLSTQEQWRYRSIGDIDPKTLNTIKSQQQFLGSDHTNIYSKAIRWPFSNSSNNIFWFIDRKLFLVNVFDLPKTQWNLYYLQKHDVIFNSSLLLFLVLSLLSLLVYFLVKGRLHLAESDKRHELLEIKQKEELQTIIDNIHIGVIITQKSGKILSMNGYASKLLLEENTSYLKENISIHGLLSADILPSNVPVQDHFKSTITPHYIETSTTRPKENPTPVIFSVKNIQIMNDDVYLLTVIDITKRKSAENELLKINVSLEDRAMLISGV